MTPWALLTATAGLIAFHIGLFTLVGRERKSPYVINAVFPVFLLCLGVGVLCISASLFASATWLLDWAAWLLIVTMLVSLATVSRTAIRFVYFVDSVNPKHLAVVRWIKRTFRGKKVTYEHNAYAVPPELLKKVLSTVSTASGKPVDFRNLLDPVSTAIAVSHQGQSNQVLASLAVEFLAADYSVQYLSASRHPIEFVKILKERVATDGLEWAKANRQIVVIDAYSPHFAFTDSWLPKRTAELEALGVTYVRATMTYAGIHSAAARAFNKLKTQIGGDSFRKPTIVIYEDTSALVDLESREQFHIFVRHVMPSERMWGGMFTVFIEAKPTPDDWNLLQAGASLAIDIKEQQESPAPTTQPASSEKRVKVTGGAY